MFNRIRQALPRLPIRLSRPSRGTASRLAVTVIALGTLGWFARRTI